MGLHELYEVKIPPNAIEAYRNLRTSRRGASRMPPAVQEAHKTLDIRSVGALCSPDRVVAEIQVERVCTHLNDPEKLNESCTLQDDVGNVDAAQRPR